MKVSSSNIKKIIIFSQKKAFLIISQKKAFLRDSHMKPCTFHPSSKNKRNPPRENFLYFRKRKSQKNIFCFL